MDYGRVLVLTCILFNIVSAAAFDDFDNNDEHSNIQLIKYCELYGKKVGICGDIFDCQPFFELVRKSGSNSGLIKNKLSKYFCGSTQYRRAEICCPFQKLIERFGNTPEEHKNINLIPRDICGPSPNSKFYRGGYAELTDYPWTALLKYEQSNPAFQCSGSLINNRYILTSAQCIQNKFKLTGVRLGEYDLSTNTDCISIVNKKFCKDPPIDLPISSEDAIIHPEFNETKFQNDIALIRLRTEIKFTTFIVPVCLPISQSTPLFDSDVYTTIGWGLSNTGPLNSILRYDDVLKLNDTTCNKYIRKVTRAESKGTQICTKGLREKPDACVGDKGGSLINTSSDDIADVQYGIISGIPSQCNSSTPIIHTKVSSYVNWILDNIKP